MDKPTVINDQIFIYPTDTVWGIGCSIYSKKGYERIAEIKKSDSTKPLSILFASINELVGSFRFPSEMSASWLREFFKLESTLGIPKSEALIEIPLWATGDSRFVSIRSMETEATKSIYQSLKTPFFTTSLNITGQSPITTLEEAKLFQQMHAPDATIVSKMDKPLSGSSSSIVFIDETKKVSIIRKGQKINDVLELLEKLK